MLICFGPGVKPVDFGKFGEWSIVTGGTDGIGKEYVRQLAKLGQNIIVIGRNAGKLASVRSEVESFGRQCKTVQADLSKQNEIATAVDSVSKLCNELEIGVLVNNAGVSYEHADFYHNLSLESLESLVDVNCTSLMMITQAFMARRVELRKGLVINISSLFATIPAPMFSLYAASKSFVRHFSKSIYHEYSGFYVDVQCVMPGMVQTKMTGLKRSSYLAPSPERFVADALCTATRLTETHGYLGHELQTATFALPDCILGPFLKKQFIKVREKALAKKAKAN